MPTVSGLSQRDREEARDAVKASFIEGSITSIEARARMGALGFNATQVAEALREAMHIVINDTRAASAKRRGVNEGEGT